MNKKRDLRYGGSVCGKEEEKAIFQCVKNSIKSGNWQAGEQARLMEEEASKQLNVKHGILTVSGSCAGLLALSALELPRGSEVIISAVTFPTIFNIILQLGLVPVVVDAEVGTYNFNVSQVEDAITEKTGAIIAVHAVGNPCDMPALMKMVKKFSKKIYVIEDNCDGWGSSINGRMVGSFGDISITSFHAAHIVSMGVGGGVFTDDSELAKKVRMYRDWGRQANTNEPNKYASLPKDYNPRFIYEKIGYNFQILELQAAMGRVQLKRAETIKRLRGNNAQWIVNELKKKCPNKFVFPKTVKGADVCWFSIPLTYLGDRASLVAHLEKNGIETRSMFSGDITKHPAYKDSEYRISGKLVDAHTILRSSFWITCHPRLTKDDRKFIVKTFEDYFNGKAI